LLLLQTLLFVVVLLSVVVVLMLVVVVADAAFCCCFVVCGERDVRKYYINMFRLLLLYCSSSGLCEVILHTDQIDVSTLSNLYDK